jgi:hypothetical protein
MKSQRNNTYDHSDFGARTRRSFDEKEFFFINTHRAINENNVEELYRIFRDSLIAPWGQEIRLLINESSRNIGRRLGYENINNFRELTELIRMKDLYQNGSLRELTYMIEENPNLANSFVNILGEGVSQYSYSVRDIGEFIYLLLSNAENTPQFRKAVVFLIGTEFERGSIYRIMLSKIIRMKDRNSVSILLRTIAENQEAFDGAMVETLIRELFHTFGLHLGLKLLFEVMLNNMEARDYFLQAFPSQIYSNGKRIYEDRLLEESGLVLDELNASPETKAKILDSIDQY